MKIIFASCREIPPEISCHYTAGQAEMNREQDSDAAVSQRASLNSMKFDVQLCENRVWRRVLVDTEMLFSVANLWCFIDCTVDSFNCATKLKCDIALIYYLFLSLRGSRVQEDSSE